MVPRRGFSTFVFLSSCCLVFRCGNLMALSVRWELVILSSFLVWWEECVKDWVFGVAVVVVFKQKSARKDNTATHKNFRCIRIEST